MLNGKQKQKKCSCNYIKHYMNIYTGLHKYTLS